MYHPLLLPDLRILLDENDEAGLQEFCEVLHPAVTAEVLQGLDIEDVWKVLSHCPRDRQIEIFEFMDVTQQVELVQGLDRARLSRLLEDMSPDDRVDLLSRMDADRVEDLLPLIAQAERSDIRKLLSYPEGSAGSIMTTEYASLPEDITVGEALEQLRLQAPDSETIYYVYVLDESRRLRGIITLRELILLKPDKLVGDQMKRDVISVRVNDDREFVAQELARYNLIAIPVVDDQNRLVGIVTHDDVLDVVQEEADEDAYMLGAVHPLEDDYLQTPLHTLTWKRGVWLLFLSGVALLTAEVLNGYEAITEAHVWIILFLPLVLASGGNAGSQSATLIIRALAQREFSRRENAQMAWREIRVGGLLGISLAGVAWAAASLLFGLDTLRCATVASTLFAVVIMGTGTGALLPILFKRMGMDPALMSTPLIAAIVDVVGVIIYYSAAQWMLGQVTG